MAWKLHDIIYNLGKLNSDEKDTFWTVLQNAGYDDPTKEDEARSLTQGDLNEVGLGDLKLYAARKALLRALGASAQTEPFTIVLVFRKTKYTLPFLQGIPTWNRLCATIEAAVPALQAEEYLLKAGKKLLSSAMWLGWVAKKTELTVAAISQARPFSSYSADSTWLLLNLVHQHVEQDEDMFPKPEFKADTTFKLEFAQCTGLTTHGDVAKWVGIGLSVCCYYRSPADHTKEASRRELITPVLIGAIMISEEVEIHAEFAATGTVAKGSVDYVLAYKNFCIVVVEGKLHEQLEEHLGQLAAEMRACREQYSRVYLGKRKHDGEGDFAKVPSFGILSNGLTYIFYKYEAESRRLIKCKTMQLALKERISAADATKEAVPVMMRIVGILDQNMQGFKRSRENV